ncbi:MAG: tetratricopeptide repeat protein [Thermodesulfobacteriota bacterium]|nr:tetratricopeptide repeat protein [Thermodesulfobacteriota bacterium]
MTKLHNHAAALITALAIAVIGILVYANTFHAPFLFDDHINIIDNPRIRMTALSFSGIATAAKNESRHRPLPNVSFAFNYFFHQYDTSGYHIINLIIHLTTAFLIFLVARHTLQQLNQDSTMTAALAAVLWLTNPIHTQSVTYIVQRMTSMAAMFYMLSLLLYIKARTKQFKQNDLTTGTAILLVASVLCGICALTSKQIAATLPVFVFLYEWYFFQNLDTAWLKRQVWLPIILVITLAIIIMVYLGNNPIDKILSMYDSQGFSIGQRLLSQPGVVLYYLSLLFFPHPARLNFYYDFPLSTLTVHPEATVLSFFGIAGLLITAMIAARKQRLVSFAILWFLGTLVIESSFIGLALVFEHRTYLPSIFLFIAIVPVLMQLLKHRELAMMLTGTAIVVCGVWTFQRNSIWQDAVHFWQNNVAKSPQIALPYNNLGLAYKKAGKTELAQQAFETAIEKNPRHYRTYNNLGLFFIDRGKPEAAIDYFNKALSIYPFTDITHINMGNAFLALEKFDKAIQHLEKAIAINPYSAEAFNSLGIVYLKTGDPGKAAHYFQKAIQINPYYGKAFNNLGIAYFYAGQTAKAVRYFKKAETVAPNQTSASANLDKLLKIKDSPE